MVLNPLATAGSYGIASSRKNNETHDVPPNSKPEQKIVPSLVIGVIYVHVTAMYGIYLCFTSAALKTIILHVILHMIAILGMTAGAHRLWSHKSYKAKMPLQIILMLFSCVASQYSIENWIKDHRMHHKYSDTDADPHNASRGFFYAHIGWLMMTKHREFKEKRKILDMSDIHRNPIIMFQKKYAFFLAGLLGFIIPTFLPIYIWNESFINAWHITLLRFCIDLNITFCINSFGHSMGYRPYDRNILPSQQFLMSIFTLGEGNHNYHHVFPSDYRGDEWGCNYFNLTTLFIDFFKMVGWAYDLKSVNPKVVKARAIKTGDGSYMSWDTDASLITN